MGELKRIYRGKGIFYDVDNYPQDKEVARARGVVITNLVYDVKTKIVYYKFETYYGSQHCVGFMSPYISENGKYCRFVNYEIVEID